MTPPPDHAALLEAAIAAHRAGRAAEAEEGYATILAHWPGDPDALNLTGVLRLEAGDPAAALGLFDRAIAALPGAAAFHHHRALALEALERPGEAADALGTALALEPGAAAWAFERARLLALAGRLGEAREAWQGVLAATPDDMAARYNLGLVLVDLEDPAAEEVLRTVRMC